MLKGSKYDFSQNTTGYPELSFHSETPWTIDESSPTLAFAYMYAEDHKKYKTKKDCFIYIAVNAHWESHSFELPIIPAEMSWHLSFDSNGLSAPYKKEKKIKNQGFINLGPRSTCIIIGY